MAIWSRCSIWRAKGLRFALRVSCDSLQKIGPLLEVPEDSRYVIYGGSEVLETRHEHVLSLREAHRLAV